MGAPHARSPARRPARAPSSGAPTADRSTSTEPDEAPARVFKIDIATGRRELWKTIAPADRSGLVAIDNIVMTPDARSYAYSYQRILTNLEVAEGLR